VVKGTGKVFIENKVYPCKKGSSYEIKKRQKHSIENTGRFPLEIIEIQSGPKLVEEDIVRLQDKYGRA
jgi:mannose-6-phosphate isomerase-like protein (cupin superfamily)